MANTLAYYDMATITAVKSFIVQAAGGLYYKTLRVCNLQKYQNDICNEKHLDLIK